ncbi:MAG: small basic family protein [Clostridia bacterium]|nr:small basic family protein [Clostridia bacterium]
MVVLSIIIGCLVGVILGVNAPTISYIYSDYLAISIVAALDSVFGGITATLKENFDFKIFVTGFFGNAILSILLTFIGNKLNVDIYLAAIVVFVGRMFNNLTMIRRFYLEKWSKMKENKTTAQEESKE